MRPDENVYAYLNDALPTPSQPGTAILASHVQVRQAANKLSSGKLQASCKVPRFRVLPGSIWLGMTDGELRQQEVSHILRALPCTTR
jgi:hypothetical protein